MSLLLKDEPLFRTEVTKKQSDRLYGKVLIHQPLSLSLVTFIITLFCLCIGLFLAQGTYSRRETAQGYLVPDKGVVKIFATSYGLVKFIGIKEGQTVKKDELLVTVSTLQKNKIGKDKDELLLKELMHQRANLNSLQEKENRTNDLDLERITQKLRNIKNERKTILKSLTIINQRIKLSTKKLTKIRQLYKTRFVSGNSVDELQQQVLELQSKQNLLYQQDIQVKTKINDLKNQQLITPINHNKKVVEFKQQISTINQQIVEITGRRNYSIHAPISGKIAAIHVSVGQRVNTQSPLIVIVPANSELKADLFLPTRAVGFIHDEQIVQLRYSAFPYQHYGVHRGVVSNITRTIISPQELPIPIPIKEPVYRVQVDLKSQNIRAFGKQYLLQSGMLLEADIILEKRSLIQWIFEPIYGLFGELSSE